MGFSSPDPRKRIRERIVLGIAIIAVPIALFLWMREGPKRLAVDLRLTAFGNVHVAEQRTGTDGFAA